MNGTWRVVVVAAGLILVGVATWQVVDTGNNPTALVIAGALVLLSPFYLDRLESFAVGATGVELTLTKSIVDLGAPKAAAAIEVIGPCDVR